MVKERVERAHEYLCLGLFLITVLAFFIFSGIAWGATPVTANLKVSPSPTVHTGGSLTFQAAVFHNPAFLSEYGYPPGVKLRVWVTRHDFSWISEKLDVNYPTQGQQVILNFAQKFSVPSNAAAGQTYDFYVVFGPWYPISNKASTKVMLLLPKDARVLEKIQKTAPVK